MTELLAWAVVPLALAAVLTGLGLLVERLAGLSLAPALLAPLGACGAIVVALPVLQLGGHGAHAAAAIVVLAAAGLAAGRDGLAARLRPGWGFAAGVAVYLLYMAPVLASGRWGWSGYAFLSDSSIHMLLADRLEEAGVSSPGARDSTTAAVLDTHLQWGYPLGSHALLAATSAAAPVRLDALYQPLIALFAALGAGAAAAVARSAGLARPAAALAGAAALAANLTHQFGLQGSIKEVAAVCCLLTAAAVAAHLLDPPERAVRAWGAVAIPAAAALAALGIGAAAPVGLLAVGATLALWRAHGRAAWRTLAVFGGAMAAVGLPALVRVVSFDEGFTFFHAPARGALGNLLAPLNPLQAAGIWLEGDYRLTPPGWREPVSIALALLVAAAALFATVAAVRRRSPALPALVVPLVGGAVLVAPFTTPWADAKLYALAGPAVVIAAATAIARMPRPAAAAGAVVLGGCILASGLLAYRTATVAPTDRLDALAGIAAAERGAGPILVNEPEEFAKWAMRDARPNVGTEPRSPRMTQLRSPVAIDYHHFNLDDQTLEFVTGFPVIVQRAAPDASRPPLSYRRVARGRWYETWRRDDRVEVRAHLPIGAAHTAAAQPACRDVLELARRARPGDVLAAAAGPDVGQVSPTAMDRPGDWEAESDPYLPDTVRPGSAGVARGRLALPPGRYRVWLQGSFGRSVEVAVDGRVVGAAEGFDLPGLWDEVGQVTVTGGEHAVELRRGGASLEPGSGSVGRIGPLAFERPDSRRVVTVPPREALRLCGGTFDWIELVARLP